MPKKLKQTKYETLTISITSQMREDLERVAEKYDVYMSEVVRDALENYLSAGVGGFYKYPSHVNNAKR